MKEEIIMKKIMLCAVAALMFGFGFESEGMEMPDAEFIAKRTVSHITWETEWDHLDDNMVIQKFYDGGYIPSNEFPGVNLDFIACYEGFEPYKLRMMFALYNSGVSITESTAPVTQEWIFRINETEDTFKVREILGRGFVFDKSEVFTKFIHPLIFTVVSIQGRIVPALNQEVMTSITPDMPYTTKGDLLSEYFRKQVTLVSK
jgi:hypothetical protein